MIGSSVNGSNAISARGKTIGNICSKYTIDSCRVQTLEKGELGRIGDCRRCQGRNRLDDDVRVSDELASTVDLLRSTEVIRLGVHEVTRLHVGDCELDGERLVGIDISAIGGEDEFCRRHILLGKNNTHGNRVARTVNNLLTIGQREVRLCQTEVDARIAR